MQKRKKKNRLRNGEWARDSWGGEKRKGPRWCNWGKSCSSKVGKKRNGRRPVNVPMLRRKSPVRGKFGGRVWFKETIVPKGVECRSKKRSGNERQKKGTTEKKKEKWLFKGGTKPRGGLSRKNAHNEPGGSSES